MKRVALLLTFLAVFLLSFMLPHFDDNSLHSLAYKQHKVITFDWDSGTETEDKSGKKISIVPGISSLKAIETAVAILLLLAQGLRYIPQFRRRLFIGTIFNQSNYVSHFN